ncbi:STAS domain-containing protein [Streptomyces sp. JJ66]|uniref:STAS domain-containing protein n=1 Tax=Streptomyces sp. JJ66 TaxID=2803843 RepID=UPI001C595258|nr:STAS domain-containing protein [Streptomyces sp. JJ66]MBW1604211.1 STAS domain-containing protein [Streptomyces sp. JJ66]
MSSLHESSPAPGPVVAEQYARDGAHVIVVRGELDLDAAPALAQAIEDARRGGATRVVADFTDVAFCDSTGLNTLLQAHLGGDLRLAAPGASVLRLLQVTGADSVLRVYPAVAEAVGD